MGDNGGSYGMKGPGSRYLELPDGSIESVPDSYGDKVAPEERARLRYNNPAKSLEASINRGDYREVFIDNVANAQVADWWIDPVSGSDDNDGQSAAAPLKTHQELRRRIGGALIGVEVTVHLLDDFPADDPVIVDFNLTDGGRLHYVGEKTPTVLESGSFTDVTVIAAATNQATEVEDTALSGDWGALGLVNAAGGDARRIRITAGSNPGAIAWACKDLGSKRARTSAFGIKATFAGNGPPGIRNVSPALNDDYVVESGFVKIARLNVDVGGSEMVPGGGVLMQVLFEDVELDPANDVVHHANAARTGQLSAQGLIFTGCALGNTEFEEGDVAVEFSRLDAADVTGGDVLISAALLLEQTLALLGSRIVFTTDTIVQGAPVECENAFCSFERCAVFDAAADAILLSHGNAITSTVFAAPALYGSGNGAFGMQILAGSVFAYDPQGQADARAAGISITGTSGDYDIAGGGARDWGLNAAPDDVTASKLAGVAADSS